MKSPSGLNYRDVIADTHRGFFAFALHPTEIQFELNYDIETLKSRLYKVNFGEQAPYFSFQQKWRRLKVVEQTTQFCQLELCTFGNWVGSDVSDVCMSLNLQTKGDGVVAEAMVRSGTIHYIALSFFLLGCLLAIPVAALGDWRSAMLLALVFGGMLIRQIHVVRVNKAVLLSDVLLVLQPETISY